MDIQEFWGKKKVGGVIIIGIYLPRKLICGLVRLLT